MFKGSDLEQEAAWDEHRRRAMFRNLDVPNKLDVKLGIKPKERVLSAGPMRTAKMMKGSAGTDGYEDEHLAGAVMKINKVN